jgi:hypothetical protein
VEVFVFSDSTRLKKLIDAAPRSRNFPVALFPVGEIRSRIKKPEKQVFVYIDCAGLDHELYAHLSYLAKKENVWFGIIDARGSVYDVAELFFLGAVDYIGAMDISEDFTETRFRAVLKYVAKYRKASEMPSRASAKSVNHERPYRIARTGWNEIETGKEYTFQIMFIELDGARDIEKRYTKKNLQDALAVFYSYIKKYVTTFQGRIWFWKDLGGIVLFPFTGRECKSVTAGFIIYLYKLLHDVEESRFPNLISFRMAIHMGNVVYAKKETGNVISDTINTVFHIGQKFASPGCFYITDEIQAYMPPQLVHYFVPAGRFEDRAVFSMKHPIFAR